MPIQVSVRLRGTTADDVISGYGASPVVQLQRDTTSAFAAPTDVTTIAVILGTERYEYWDASGTDASWYRTRYENAGGTVTSDWSTGFQGGGLQAYAALESLRLYVDLPDTTRDELLEELLAQASGYIDDQCDRDFYRHPQVSGTEVRTYDSDGRLAVLYEDIISLTTVEIASGTGQTYATIAAGSTGYYLRPATVRTGRPYESLVLSDQGLYTHVPAGRAVLRLTGAFGWSSVPAAIERATIEVAREWYRQGPGGGGPIGVTAFGTPIFGGAMPRSVRDAIAAYRHYIVV